MDLNGIIEPKIFVTETDVDTNLTLFLCHAHEDKPQVRILYQKLLELGIDVWFDEECLLPGMEWKEAILSVLPKIDIFVICLSTNSIQKTGFVQKEIRESLEIAELQPEGKIFILPIRLDDCEVPHKLTKYQYLDLFSENAFTRLITTLNYIKSNKKHVEKKASQPINLYLGFVDDISPIVEKSFLRNVILIVIWAESGMGERNAYKEFLKTIPYLEEPLIQSGFYMAYTNPGQFIFVSSLAGHQLKRTFGVKDSGVYYISKGKLLDFKKFPFAAGPDEILETISTINF